MFFLGTSAVSSLKLEANNNHTRREDMSRTENGAPYYKAVSPISYILNKQLL